MVAEQPQVAGLRGRSIGRRWDLVRIALHLSFRSAAEQRR
jgi:hypothetical protein